MMTKPIAIANLLGMLVFAYLQFNLFKRQGTHSFTFLNHPSGTDELTKGFNHFDTKQHDISIKSFIYNLLRKGGQRQATQVNLTALMQYFNYLNRKNNPFIIH